ncbi:MAG TPA: sulfur carrier protein ThiS [Thermoanaerobaculia bacterium]|nr:sulfur carrier protein ThiS [Thermoanaerobaculia bacterium]
MSAARELRIRVNGREVLIADGASVAALLETLSVSSPRVAVELNSEIVPKAEYATTMLGEGDELEVVEFVGGG